MSRELNLCLPNLLDTSIVIMFNFFELTSSNLRRIEGLHMDLTLISPKRFFAPKNFNSVLHPAHVKIETGSLLIKTTFSKSHPNKTKVIITT